VFFSCLYLFGRVSHFRISPHTNDMLGTINIFNDTLNNEIDTVDVNKLLKNLMRSYCFQKFFIKIWELTLSVFKK